jgi:hypothetical protein
MCWSPVHLLHSLPSLKFFSDFVLYHVNTSARLVSTCEHTSLVLDPLGPVKSFDTSNGPALLVPRLIFGWYDEASMKNMVLKLI